MTWTFGSHSRGELVGVHPDLVDVTTTALQMSPIDFMVFDGIRTLAEQRQYVATGVSWTLRSRHLMSATSGYGHAVDLLPYINGRARWEWEPLYIVADAMRDAAREHNIPIRWGGCWDMWLTESIAVSCKEIAFGYAKRQVAREKELHADGPHFELPGGIYP